MERNGFPPTRSSSALLVGSDEVLLYTRQQILQKEGFHVSTVEPDRAADRLGNSHPELVVACHTLTTQEADTLVQAARQMSTPPALLSFSLELAPQPTSHPFDVTVWSLASPDTFIGKVHELLRHRALTS